MADFDPFANQGGPAAWDPDNAHAAKKSADDFVRRLAATDDDATEHDAAGNDEPGDDAPNPTSGETTESSSAADGHLIGELRSEFGDDPDTADQG